MAVVLLPPTTSRREYTGLSTDDKPASSLPDGTVIPNGSTFTETDTGAVYRTSDGGANWVNFTSPEGGVTVVRISDLADDDSFLLPDATKGMIFFVVGDNEHWGTFSWATTGVVTEWTKSGAGIDDADTDGKFCIYDTGTQVALKNRLNSAKDLLAIYVSMP